MDFNLFFFNRCFDKNRLKALISWCLMYIGENATLEIVEDLKELGFRYATQAGISIGLNDLKTPPSKPFLVSQAEKNMRLTEQEFLGGRITATEKSQRVVDTWHRTSEILKQEVVDHFRFTDNLNPVYVMALSGARGNFSQVRQLVGMRGLMADPQGLIISFPIRSNFREGLTLTEYFISCYGARKGLVDTALRTADTGYLTRRLVDVSHHVVVRKTTCKTQNGILLTELRSNNKTILPLKERLVGRVLAATVWRKQSDTSDALFIQSSLDSNTPFSILAKRDQEISVDLAEKIAALRKHVLVRSPLTCSLRFDICQLCYGWSLSQGKLVTIGEAVGIIAAQSIGEPGTQLTMRTFHTGGVFSGDLLEEINSPYSGYINFPNALQGLLIRTPHGRIAFLTKTPGLMVLMATLSLDSPRENSLTLESSTLSFGQTTAKDLNKVLYTPKVGSISNSKRRSKSNNENIEPYKKIQFPLETSTVLFVRQGEKVLKDQLLAEFSAVNEEQNERIQSKQILFAELSGQVYVESLIQRTNRDPDTGYQQKLSETLGFVWIFSGKEFTKNKSLALYKRNGHLVDTESIQFRAYKTNAKKNRNQFLTRLGVSNSNTAVAIAPIEIESVNKKEKKYLICSNDPLRKDLKDLRVQNKKIGVDLSGGTLFHIFAPTQVLPLTVFSKTNYKNKYGYALSFFPVFFRDSQKLDKSLIAKNKKSDSFVEIVEIFDFKRKHVFSLISDYLIFSAERNQFNSNIDPRNEKKEWNKENLGLIVIKAERPDKDVDKLFFPQRMFSIFEGSGAVIGQRLLDKSQFDQSWATKMKLFTSGKILRESPKKVDNLYPNSFRNQQWIKELFSLQKKQKGKNRYLEQKSSNKDSIFLNKQKTSKFLFLWFIGRSSLLSGGSLEFHRLYSEKNKKKGQFFWLPQENYKVVNLFQSFNKDLTSQINQYLTDKKHINSLETQNGLKNPLLKKSLLKGIEDKDVLHFFRPKKNRFLTSKISTLPVTFASSSRKSVLNFQKSSLVEYGAFAISPVALTLCCGTACVQIEDSPTIFDAPTSGFFPEMRDFKEIESVKDKLRSKGIQSLENITSKISKAKAILRSRNEANDRLTYRYLSQKEIATIYKGSFSRNERNEKKSKKMLSIVGFWGDKKISLGSALNLQGDFVAIFSKSSGWFTRYSIPTEENIDERYLPRFTANYEKVFLDHTKNLNVFSQEKRADSTLWANLRFVRGMRSEISKTIIDLNVSKARNRLLFQNKVLERNISPYVPSNPCAQRHKAVLNASFNLLGRFFTERKNVLKTKESKTGGRHSQSVERFVAADKKADPYLPVLHLQYQRLALLNLLPSFVFTHMKSQKSKKRTQNYCIKVKPGWLYLPKDPCMHVLEERKTSSSRNERKELIDDIAFEQIKANIEHVRFHDFPFYLPLKESSAVSVSLNVQSTFVNSLLQSPSFNLLEKDIKSKISLSPLKSKRGQTCISLWDTWEKLCKESSAKLNRNNALLCYEMVNTPTNCLTISDSLLHTKNADHNRLKGVDFKEEESFKRNRALMVALEKNTKQGIVGRLTSKKMGLPNYLSLKNRLGKQQKSFESGIDRYVLLLLRQLLWTDSESFPMNKDWEFTSQQFYELGWLREYRVSSAIITNSTGRYSLPCLPVYKSQKYSSSLSLLKSKIKNQSSICRVLSPQQKEMYSFEINQAFFSTSLNQENKLTIDFLTETEKTVRKGSFSDVTRFVPKRRKRVELKTASLFQKVYEKNFVDVSNCKKLLYDSKINFIGTRIKDRIKGTSLAYSNKQEIVPLYKIAQEVRFNISQSLPLGTGIDEVFSLAPFHFLRLAVNLTSSFANSLDASKLDPSNPQINKMLDSVRQNRRFNNTLIVDKDLYSQRLYPEDNKRSSFISLKGEIVHDPLGDMVLLNSDQVSFFTEAQTIQVVPGQLVRSGEKITTKHTRARKQLFNPSQKEIKVISPNTGVELESINLSPTLSPLVTKSTTKSWYKIVDKDIRLAVDRSGQVLKIEKNQITLRKAQAVLFYSQAISHVSHGQWVTNGSPILTLTHQTLVTGDIVQGIPKIEQFFEASATKQGIPLAENLHKKLQTIFKEHKRDLPRPEAVRKSLEDIQQVLVEGIQRVYLSQGVLIADKHLEVVVRQMTSKGRIIESGDTGLFHGEIIPIRRIEGVNLMTPGSKALYVPAVIGLTRTSLDSESFISAASFQETTRVLTRDVISGKTDFLRGLKEKVILGDLISAGTGLENYFMYNLVMVRTSKKRDKIVKNPLSHYAF